jgi:hypothetical protein
MQLVFIITINIGIIQNAEDAEASQMKILYDERCVNQSDGSKGKSFQKYFKVY